jgi:hypothetical protein
MRRTLLILTMCGLAGAQQWTAPPPSADPTLNSFLGSLGAMQYGAGSPAGTCSAGKDWYTDTAGPVLYGCGSAGWFATAVIPGTGAPGSGLGVAGSYYLRTDTMCLYGPKTSAWPGSCSPLWPQPLTTYSTISGLSGYPATFPPATGGDWTGTWQTYGPAHFQAAISGAPGTWPSFGGAALLSVGTTTGTVAAGDDSRLSNARTPTAHNLLSSYHGDTSASAAVRGGAIFAVGATPTWTQVAHSSATGATAGTGSCTNQVVTAENADAAPSCSTITSAYVDASVMSQSDIPTFVICTTAGCLAETTFNNWFVSAANGITFDECGFALQTAPTVQSVIVDIQTAAGVSIFGATKLVIATSASTTTFQSTFANSPQTAAKGAQFKAVITQSDTGGAALGGYVKCRVH